MSSTFKVQRICQHCKNEFTAQKTTTKFCSHKCAQKAYKVRERNTKIDGSNQETENIKTKPIEDLKSKEFLTAREVAKLLNCSIRTVYYSIEQGTINAVNLSQRMTRIRRVDIEQLFDPVKEIIIENKKEEIETPLELNDCYDIRDVQEKYGVSYNGLNAIIKRNKVPKIRKGWFTYVHKTTIDNLLSK